MNPRSTPARYSHSGICVSDLQRSKDFYVEVFGFGEGTVAHVGPEYSRLLGIEAGLVLTVAMLTLGGLTIELLAFQNPAAVGDGVPAPMYRLGLAHLSFNVDSLEAKISDVERWGGTVLHGTRTTFHRPDMAGDIIFVADPDGTRIELMCFPSDPSLVG